MSDNKAARLAAIRAANAAKQASSPQAALSQSTGSAQSSMAGNIFDQGEAVSFSSLLTMLIGCIIGVALAVFIVPMWLPDLSNSILSAQPKVYWYLSRSSAIVAYVLLWLSMLFGLLITSKMSGLWPGGPTAFDLHQYSSLLGLTFALFHALILMGDTYINSTLLQIVMPFSYAGYQPFWVGLGQLALYGLMLVGMSFYVKKYLSHRIWRLIHFLSFAIFLLALAHGIWSGTDSSSQLVGVMYWASAGSVLFLTLSRILGGVKLAKRQAMQPSDQQII